MTIDVAKLCALLDAERRSEWAVDGRHVYGNGTKYSFGEFEETTQADLAVTAVNALPVLLAVFEAARKLRMLRPPIYDGALPTDVREFLAAVDAARGLI